MSSKRNFLDTMHFLHYFGKCFGLSNYTLSKQRTKYKVSFKIVDFLQLCACLTVYIFLIHYNFLHEWKIANGYKNSVIFNSGQHILVVTALLGALAGIFQALWKRQMFWETVNSLDEIDNQMKRLLKIEINHDLLYRYSLIYVTISFVLLALVYSGLSYYFFLVTDNWMVVIRLTLSFVLSNAAFVFMSMQFQVMMYSMYLRFSMLNGFVESNLLQNSPQLLTLTSSKTMELQKNLFSIAKLTDQLNNVVPKLCCFFGPTMILSFTGLFVVTVFNFHNFYRALNEKNNTEFYILILSYDFLSFIFNIWSTIAIAISSINISSAKRMGVLIHKVIARTQDKKFILMLKVLSQQVLHRSPDFSFGLFSMNFPFIYSYVASVVSYIVILIQFENHITEGDTGP